VASGALLVAVGGNTNELIPLFAIGVFIGFTLSQAGLVVHWRRTRPPGWVGRATINGVGAVMTASATIIFLVSKFLEGAWVVVVTVPLLILLFTRIHRYYVRAKEILGFGLDPGRPERRRTLVVVPVTGVSRLTRHAICEALSLGDEVMAVTVVFDGEVTGLPWSDIEDDWQRWDPGVPLEVLHTDYASIVQPIVRFVDGLLERKDRQLVVLIPVLIPEKIRYRLLHNQTDLVLSSELRRRTDLVVARVPMPLRPPAKPEPAFPAAAAVPEVPEVPTEPTEPAAPTQPSGPVDM